MPQMARRIKGEEKKCAPAAGFSPGRPAGPRPLARSGSPAGRTNRVKPAVFICPPGSLQVIPGIIRPKTGWKWLFSASMLTDETSLAIMIVTQFSERNR